MKRFLTLMGLALGITVSSYATLINSTTGPTGNLASGGAGLITFDEAGFPLGAFSSLPFSVTSGSNTFTGTVQWLNQSNATCTVPTQCGSLSNALGTGSDSLTNWNSTGSLTQANSFGRTLRITFTSGNVGEFGLLLRGNDSSNGSAFTSGLNYMVVNFVGGGSTTNQALPNQFNDPTAVNFFGWNGNAGGNEIASVDFVITGDDAESSRAFDVVTFDDLRVFASSTSGSTSGGGGTSTGGGGGEIPEPSTYALIGTGLAALAYARRRKS